MNQTHVQPQFRNRSGSMMPQVLRFPSTQTQVQTPLNYYSVQPIPQQHFQTCTQPQGNNYSQTFLNPYQFQPRNPHPTLPPIQLRLVQTQQLNPRTSLQMNDILHTTPVSHNIQPTTLYNNVPRPPPPPPPTITYHNYGNVSTSGPTYPSYPYSSIYPNPLVQTHNLGLAQFTPNTLPMIQQSLKIVLAKTVIPKKKEWTRRGKKKVVLDEDAEPTRTTCHQCKLKTRTLKLRCCQCLDLIRSTTAGVYCKRCLKNRYGENFKKIKKEDRKSWICPVCRGICNCAACKKIKKEKNLTTKFEANALGSDSVHHMLEKSENKKEEEDDLSEKKNKKRKRGKESVNSDLEKQAKKRKLD